MKVIAAELHFLSIPLTLSVTHGAHAARTASDSLILELTGAGGARGYGEAVVREYVSGALASDGAEGFAREAAAGLSALLGPLRGREISWPEAAAALAAARCEPPQLPLLCAVETALLDLACAESGDDAYDVIGMQPLRTTVTYGGVIPIVPPSRVEAYVSRYKGFRFGDAKVKLGSDPAYTDAVLGACRRLLGDGFDIRADANSSWTTGTAEAHLSACARHGVTIVEQPFAAGTAPALLREARARGFTFMADEGILEPGDLDGLATGGFDMLNLRLAKNGGLARVLSLAAAAGARGMRSQLGCMVGETAVLSAMGRVAASLLPSPAYLEGSYDEIILTRNVAEKGMGFGPGGAAAVVRGNGIGARVSPALLAASRVRSAAC